MKRLADTCGSREQRKMLMELIRMNRADEAEMSLEARRSETRKFTEDFLKSQRRFHVLR